ncbi:MAG: hypothetical protein AB7S93_20830 [Xanthobacteraceae bacterium]
MDVFTAALNAIFDDPNITVEATYTAPASGEPVACRVLLDQRDRELAGISGRPVIEGRTLTVRKSEIAAPARGGAFEISGETLMVLDDPRCEDALRLLWVMTVR